MKSWLFRLDTEAGMTTISYELSPQESPEGRARLADGYAACTFRDRETLTHDPLGRLAVVPLPGFKFQIVQYRENPPVVQSFPGGWVCGLYLPGSGDTDGAASVIGRPLRGQPGPAGNVDAAVQEYVGIGRVVETAVGGGKGFIGQLRNMFRVAAGNKAVAGGPHNPVAEKVHLHQMRQQFAVLSLHCQGPVRPPVLNNALHSSCRK